MGCNCGGSTARTNKEPRRFQPTVHDRPASAFRPRREGGPGDPRYYGGGKHDTPQKPA